MEFLGLESLFGPFSHYARERKKKGQIGTLGLGTALGTAFATPLQLPVISQNLGQYFFNGKCITKKLDEGVLALIKVGGDDH